MSQTPARQRAAIMEVMRKEMRVLQQLCTKRKNNWIDDQQFRQLRTNINVRIRKALLELVPDNQP